MIKHLAMVDFPLPGGVVGGPQCDRPHPTGSTDRICPAGWPGGERAGEAAGIGEQGVFGADRRAEPAGRRQDERVGYRRGRRGDIADPAAVIGTVTAAPHSWMNEAKVEVPTGRVRCPALTSFTPERIPPELVRVAASSMRRVPVPVMPRPVGTVKAPRSAGATLPSPVSSEVAAVVRVVMVSSATVSGTAAASCADLRANR